MTSDFCRGLWCEPRSQWLHFIPNDNKQGSGWENIWFQVYYKGLTKRKLRCLNYCESSALITSQFTLSCGSNRVPQICATKVHVDTVGPWQICIPNQSLCVWTHRRSQDEEDVNVGLMELLIVVQLLPQLPEHLRAREGDGGAHFLWRKVDMDLKINYNYMTGTTRVCYRQPLFLTILTCSQNLIWCLVWQKDRS